MSDKYFSIGSIEFQTQTVWQRLDSIVDILNNKVPDHELVKGYIDNGHWDNAVETCSEWFSRTILEQNNKALQIVNDNPDLLIIDSLSDWSHSLYKHKKYGWKCLLGEIVFTQQDIEDRFNAEFEFIGLLDIKDVKRYLTEIIGFFKAKNGNLKTVYVHFPVPVGYLEEKWSDRSEELIKTVAVLGGDLGQREFFQIVVPQDIVKPITDPSHPNYSPQVWNHFEDEVYEYCARRILEWYA